MSPTDSGLSFPQLVAFDLDYTLWDLWIDTHVTGPLHRNKETLNQVLDRYNDPISFYKDVPQILHRLRATPEVKIAACSRTDAPKLARQCLSLLLVPLPPDRGHTSEADISAEPDSDAKPKPAIGFFDELEIYPGSKLTHFRNLHSKTGIPYSEMLFFDDELRNAEVEKLGVMFVHTPHGTTCKIFEEGLGEWRKRRQRTAQDV